jgi:hypothetical protein
MNTSHNTRSKSLRTFAAKPLVALAALVGAIVLAGPASAGPQYPPVITGVLPSTSVCPGQVLTLTGDSGPWGFDGTGFQAQVRRTGTTTTPLVVPVFNTVAHTTGTDTTQLIVPTTLTYGATYDLWLSRPYTGGTGPAVQITIKRAVMCATSSSGGSAQVGAGVPINP